MRTVTHRLFGATATLAVLRFAPELAPAGWDAALYVGAAVVASGGRTSPDVDNWRLAKAADRLLPDEVLGWGGPLKHRGLLHWWGLPAAAAVLVVSAGLSPSVSALAWGAIVGWASHLAGDCVFGQANPRVGLGRGIPVLPWSLYVGLGLRADGAVERATAVGLCGVIGWLVQGLYGTGWALAGVGVLVVAVARGAVRPSRVVTA